MLFSNIGNIEPWIQLMSETKNSKNETRFNFDNFKAKYTSQLFQFSKSRGPRPND